MSKKTGLGSLFTPVPPPTVQPAETSAQEAERLARELAGAEIDARFREGLANGTIKGDLIVVDEHGNFVEEYEDTNIFDL